MIVQISELVIKCAGELGTLCQDTVVTLLKVSKRLCTCFALYIQFTILLHNIADFRGKSWLARLIPDGTLPS